jgi:hypothetical protein
MKYNKSEQEDVVGILHECLSCLGELTAPRAFLWESFQVQSQSRKSREKIEDLHHRIEVEKEKVKQIQDSEKRRKELEKIRRDHDKDQSEKSTQNEGKHPLSITPIYDQSGRLIGYTLPLSRTRSAILNRKSQLVAYEINGVTYDRQGRSQGRGRQGLRVLGQSIKN